ncbi:MAG: disulfide bond formation protein DsbB [Parcubacteria bacterium C7867-001]|nr:MAG: disulfide bond formation protein DsbB [Parcubacteria bacterium C7867-001]
MSLEQYSIFLTLGLFGMFGLVVISAVLYFLIPKVRNHIRSHSYANFLAAIGLISVASIIGALTYQLVYLTPVCELCWWQRIFLFPIGVIAAVALWYKTREAHVTIAILSAIGLFYACYHYYYHFQGLVLGNTLSLPCSFVGLLPACTNSPILTFGFVTIPFMGILVFSSMLILAAFAHMKAKRDAKPNTV